MTGAPAVPRVDTVLLDAGGVLLDLDFPFLVRLLESHEHPVGTAALDQAEAVSRREIHHRVARSPQRTTELWRDYFHILLHEVGFPAEAHDRVIDTLWEAHQRFGLWTVPIPGAIEAVRSLRSDGYVLGVVSNAEGRVEQDLNDAGFDGLFDTVVDSHVVGVAKPDPAIFEIALRRLDAAPDRTVFVGDVPAVDMAGAHAAGIRPMLLDRHGLYDDPGVPKLSSLGELPGLLGPAPEAR